MNTDITATANHPRPLLVVHRIDREALFVTWCGAAAGDRQFDAERGTFVQHTAHYVLSAAGGVPDGMVACSACVALVAEVEGAAAA